MAYCAAPTPLYGVYQHRDGFPTIVLTVIFAVYAVGVMLSLFLAGHVSDWIGRRRVVITSLAISILSAAMFVAWNDVVGLIAARFVSGLGIGLLTATATAYMSDLGSAARRSPVRSSIAATFANLGGISLGPLAAGLIAVLLPQPLVTPYLVFGALFLVEAALVLCVPETVVPPVPRPVYRPQRVAVPARSRGAYVAAASAAFGGFAVFGTFTGLAGTFLGGILGLHSLLLTGIAPFVVFMAAALAQIATARLPHRTQVVAALVAAALGLVVLSAGALTASLALYLLGGGLAGAGVGVIFRAALASVGQISEPARRGEALAGIFFIAYAGMMAPPVLTAAALGIWPQVPVLVAFSVLIAVLVVVAGLRLRRL